MQPTRSSSGILGAESRPLYRSHSEPLLDGHAHPALVQTGVGELTGSSPAMRAVYETILCLAPTSAPIVITGETGTGKEVVARAIHQASKRPGSYVALNCANLPESLMESELFGYEKGAFTGALRRNEGCFEQAGNGTLLLDEITELPLPMQAKLLRILETHCVRRLGGTGEVSVDVRILAATNQRLEDVLGRRRLREDLYYRLNVGRIEVPPLRRRRTDIPALAESLLRDLNRKNGCGVERISRAAMDRLMAHTWPGNVRELRNVLELATIFAREGSLEEHHLPGTVGLRTEDDPVRGPANQASGTGMVLTNGRGAPAVGAGRAIEFTAGRNLREVTREYILATVEQAANRQEAARQLGISVRSLYNQLAAIKKSHNAA